MAYVFTEGSNKDLVYSILGDFWTSFFKDTFLVEGVINANTLSLDEFSNNLSKLTDTLNERTCPKIVPTSIYRLDIEDTNITHTIQKVDYNNRLTYDVFLVNQPDTIGWYEIKLPKEISECLLISTSIAFNDTVLLKDIDYIQKDASTLLFFKHPSVYGFESFITSKDGQLLKTYAFYIKGSYGNFGYASRFGRAPHALKYNTPAYDVLTNEVTITTLMQTLQRVLGAEPAVSEGTVSRIWYEGDREYAFNGGIISVPASVGLSLSIGDKVDSSSIVMKDISVYNDLWKAPIAAYYVSNNRLPITKHGILIPNTNAASDLSVSSPSLMLEDDSALVETEYNITVSIDSLSVNDDLGIKGDPEDVKAFYTFLNSGLAKYALSIQTVATSSNPLRIIFSDIHNIKIPAIVLSDKLIYTLQDISGISYTLQGMSYDTTLFVGGNVKVNTAAVVHVENKIECFMLYKEDTTTSVKISTQQHAGFNI